MSKKALGKATNCHAYASKRDVIGAFASIETEAAKMGLMVNEGKTNWTKRHNRQT
jgi:hypothetical protein